MTRSKVGLETWRFITHLLLWLFSISSFLCPYSVSSCVFVHKRACLSPIRVFKSGGGRGYGDDGGDGVGIGGGSVEVAMVMVVVVQW